MRRKVVAEINALKKHCDGVAVCCANLFTCPAGMECQLFHDRHGLPVHIDLDWKSGRAMRCKQCIDAEVIDGQA